VHASCTWETLSHDHTAGKSLLARVTPNGLLSSGRSETQVRNPSSSQGHPLISIIEHILWISESLEAATRLAPQGLRISIRIYVTGDSAFQQWDDSVSIKSGKEIGKEISEPQEKSCIPSFLEDPAVQVTTGSRPNLKQMLQEEADLTNGRMGVTGLSYRLPTSLFTSLIMIPTQCAVLSPSLLP